MEIKIEYVQKIIKNMQIRNHVDFLGFIASTQLHNTRGKQQGACRKIYCLY